MDGMRLIEGAPPVPADFFDHIEAGGMEVMLYRLLTPTQSRYAQTTPSVALEIGANVLAPALRAWITAELAEAGLVRWRHSWSGAAIRETKDAAEHGPHSRPRG